MGCGACGDVAKKVFPVCEEGVFPCDGCALCGDLGVRKKVRPLCDEGVCGLSVWSRWGTAGSCSELCYRRSGGYSMQCVRGSIRARSVQRMGAWVLQPTGGGTVRFDVPRVGCRMIGV